MQELIKSINSFKNRPFIALISYDASKYIVCEPNQAGEFGISFKLNATSKPRSYDLQKFPINFEIYKQAFDKVQNYQHNGHSYLLNLCFATPIKTDLSLEEIYTHAGAKLVLYKKDEFVCFSPEPFVRISGDLIETFPMKGTADATQERAKENLLSNKKELSEQMMITDLMRNDLSAVASGVKVQRFRYIERVNNLLQTSSHIKGFIRKEFGLGDLFAKILPAGSISGVPKIRSCEIINECEISPRGFYTGIFIHSDGKYTQSFILIRYVRKNGNDMEFMSGGGITLQSDARKEYDELIKKVYFPF